MMFCHGWRSFFRGIPSSLRQAGSLLYWSPAVVYVTTTLYVPTHITGRSMQPALNPNSSPWRDIGILDRVSVRVSRDYQKGDIVAIRSPDDAKRMLVKRIVGVEGDVIRTLPPYPDPVVHIPPGHVWVEGDEPFFSDDSNLLGPIPAALIDSKLVGILWPPSRFGPLPKPDITRKNEAAYRHAMAAFEKDRSRAARLAFDGVESY